MKCKKCGYENGIVKKTCQQCREILEGETVNNVTSETGYRNADGSFTPYVEVAKTLKEQNIFHRDVAVTKMQNAINDYIKITGIKPVIDITDNFIITFR